MQQSARECVAATGGIQAVYPWLMDSDPSLRWQVMRDLEGARGSELASERAKVGTRGWSRRLLDVQGMDGRWGDGVAAPQWKSTLEAMVLLQEMGLDPESGAAHEAVARVERVTWGSEFGDLPFFEGEVEPCINGRVLGAGAYFGRASERLVDRLLGEQLADGGWNCEAERGSGRSSFHSTICVLEGLLAYEQRTGARATVSEARRKGQEYLLERRLMRRLSTGELIRDRKGNGDWTRPAFPPAWRYDVLRGLDYLRAAGVTPDDRMAEAVGVVIGRREENGRWKGYAQDDDVGIEMEGGDGEASRWVTMRALRVLRWIGG